MYNVYGCSKPALTELIDGQPAGYLLITKGIVQRTRTLNKLRARQQQNR